MLTRSASYVVESFGRTDTGMVRENNEDAWCIVPEDNIYILADGMGGHVAGEIAAQMTVETYRKLVRRDLSPEIKSYTQTRGILYHLIEEVNQIVHKYGQSDAEMRGMGTTLCFTYFHPEGMIFGHVGDSRIYLYRKKQLEQLTEDHSLVQELIELGELTQRQARHYVHRNIITKAIGTEPIIVPPLQQRTLKIGDQIMMCSDGLTDLLSHQEIEHYLAGTDSLENKVNRLIKEANLRGGHDNITVVLMKISEKDGNLPRP